MGGNVIHEAERESRPKNTDMGVIRIEVTVKGMTMEKQYTVLSGLRTDLDLSNVASWKENKM